MDYEHKPVLLEEVLDFLRPKPGQFFIDGTLGGGGYTGALAKAVGAKGKILSFDLDKSAIINTQRKFIKQKQIILIHDNFKNLLENINTLGFKKTPNFNGIVADLGLSSAQLADESRGFSFNLDAPLDMSFGKSRKSTYSIVNKYSERDLYRIIKEYGEERYAKLIAKKIVNRRKTSSIKSTKDLVEIISQAVPASYLRKKIHFATKTFQALRIETNDELNSLKIFLPQAVELLIKGGRIAIVSFHSLEDRIVKHYFKKEARDCICPKEFPTCQCEHRAVLKILSKKPVKASPKEISNNPRSRSALLRVAMKI